MNLVRDSLNLWKLSAFASGQCRVYLAPHRASLTPAVLQPAAAPFAAAAPASCVWQGGTICQNTRHPGHLVESLASSKLSSITTPTNDFSGS